MIDNPFSSSEEKTRQQKEFKLQCHIVQRHQQYFPHVLITAFPGRPGDATDGFFKKMMGVKAGVTDILLWWDYPYPAWAIGFLKRMLEKVGFCFSRIHVGVVEIKVDAKVTPDQNKFMSTINGMGGKDGVVRSWREYYKLLCFWGIKPISECRIFDEPDFRTEQQKFSDSFEYYRP